MTKQAFVALSVAAFLFLLHLGLMLNAAWRLSPAWDEIVYPAAGAAQLATGTIAINTTHGYLAKIFYGAAVLMDHPHLPFEDPAWVSKDDFRFGYVFTFYNRIPARCLIFYSRLPAIVLSCLCALILWHWSMKQWGAIGGGLTLLGYIATPLFLSRASMALLEMPLLFFMLLALWSQDVWLRHHRWIFLGLSGFCLTCALFCKLTALEIVPGFVLLNLWLYRQHRKGLLKAGIIGVCSMGLTAGLLTLGWKGSPDMIRHMIHMGLHFDTILPYYWHGAYEMHLPAWISWGAFLIKAPLPVLLLGVGGGVAWWRSGEHRSTLLLLLVTAEITGLSILLLRQPVSTVQFALPLYVALVLAAGALGQDTIWRRRDYRMIILACAAWACADMLYAHPNYLAYFNAASGGTPHGYRWLGDSDQDWGQALGLLAEDMHRHGDPHLVLCYSGAADPRAYGLHFQDLFSPALYRREYAGELLPVDQQPVYLALSTKVLQTENSSFHDLAQNLKPLRNVGGCFLIYDITRRFDVYHWMSQLYQETGRPREAQWAAQKAEQS